MCPVSFRARSNWVTGEREPPCAGIRYRGVFTKLTRITSSRFHEPIPGSFGLMFPIVTDGPPAPSMIFIEPRSRKPSRLLSGAQNGVLVPVTSASFRDVESPRFRTQIPDLLPVMATKAMRRPSGETDTVGKICSKPWSGAGKDNLVRAGRSSRRCFQATNPVIAAIAANKAAAIQGNGARDGRARVGAAVSCVR